MKGMLALALMTMMAGPTVAQELAPAASTAAPQIAGTRKAQAVAQELALSTEAQPHLWAKTRMVLIPMVLGAPAIGQPQAQAVGIGHTSGTVGTTGTVR